jgi:hypothetical protein
MWIDDNNSWIFTVGEQTARASLRHLKRVDFGGRCIAGCRTTDADASADAVLLVASTLFLLEEFFTVRFTHRIGLQERKRERVDGRVNKRRRLTVKTSGRSYAHLRSARQGQRTILRIETGRAMPFDKIVAVLRARRVLFPHGRLRV